ncbi:MAG: hypothetical protein Tp166DCM644871_10 [Prokaryotic dsDNA virus sp.]|nr:MAG: hypothetical protein Tp166DCM644871_10 [Prokaryotic dsDNA virus sp.]QDP62610.1 MAG: hypothetical protein Tp166SUR375021_10 [Prokaryotic dsDNA virus sp.]|tara:strand:- start:903 stop:1091 length:189 start_codon:yes stop_codon:yes gene_type:complete
MKIKLLTKIIRDNVTYEKDDIIDVPEENAKVFIANLWAEYITKKEAKPNKETKEYKGKKETK